MTRKISIVIAIVVASLALLVAACGKGTDLTKVKAQAFEKASGYGPKVSGLIGKHDDLKARAGKLPLDQPGVAELLKALDAHHATLGRLKSLLDGFAVSVDKAGKSGKKADVEAATAAFATEADKDIADVTAGLDAAATSIAAMETAAAAPPVDAGVPTTDAKP